MKKSAFISDLIFTYFTSFLLFLCLFRYLAFRVLFSLLLSIVCAALATASFGAYRQSKRRELFLKKSDERLKEKLLLHLALLSDEQKTQFFQERLSTPNSPVKRFGRLRLYSDECFYALHFSCTPVDADDVLRFSRFKTGKEKRILCFEMEENARSLAENLNIGVHTGAQIYTDLKEQNALPENYLSFTAPKRKRFSLWFSRANAKRFLLAAALILFTAFISPFPYYYFLFGGVLLLLSILVRLFGSHSKSN